MMNIKKPLVHSQDTGYTTHEKLCFRRLLGIKTKPNAHEIYLFHRSQKYIKKLAWIPCIQMIAVVNSLSMYATHKDSDIDLFIITKPGSIWLVRFLSTMTFFLYGVWRQDADIRENFCLSFFITTESLALKTIAIERDIYLYHWILHMKPILTRGAIYEEFLKENSWVSITNEQRGGNMQFKLPDNTPIINSIKCIDMFSRYLNILIRFFLLPKTQKTYTKLGKPDGIIISDVMLKFHNMDLRKEISEKILKKNFDK